MGRYPLGIPYVTFLPLSSEEGCVRARELGFDHFDPEYGVDPATLTLPVGFPITLEQPRPGPCIYPAPRAGQGQWETMVEQLRNAPGCLLEPYAASCVNSIEAIRAVAAEVPGLGFVIDTAHVASWGGDPLEALEYASYVQLRQAKPGVVQLHVDDPSGVVDFAAVIRRLGELDYRGKLAVEYFDFRDMGLPLDDPVGWSADLAERVRPLLG